MPVAAPPGNVKDALRWSLESASREFGVTKDAIKRRLVEVSEFPDPKDKCFGTFQIIKAVFGDIHGERLRETKEKADNWALKNAVMRGELLDRNAILRGMEHIVTAVARLIDSSSLTKQEKVDLRNSMANWPVIVRGVAEQQSHEAVAPGKNGENGASEEAEAD
jgi:hypothetical protein